MNKSNLQADEIECPSCGEKIQVTEALKNQFTQHLKKEIEQKELLLKKREEDVESQSKKIQVKIDEAIKLKSKDIESAAQKKASETFSLEMKDLSVQLKEKDEKLKKAEDLELQMRKKEREVLEKEKNIELETARRISQERNKVVEEISKTFEEEHRLKDAEKEKKLQDAIKANEELRRKLQQGSQQTQGEVLELQIEELIRTTFPTDLIEPVPKGVSGADVVHKVFSKRSDHCGTIVWELKHTKSWSEGWIQKLKDDLRIVKGDVAILVSEVLPKGVENFSFINGIWITSPSCVLGLAMAIRGQLIEVSTTKLSMVGKNEKMEVLYNYLSGSEFRQRIEAIAESFNEMQKDLLAERRATEIRWAKREKQMQRVVSNTTGMYGDFQGLMGSSLQAIPLLSEPTESEGLDA